MASPQQLNLERSMDQFRQELTDDQRAEISGANRIVINHEIQKIQIKLGREKGLCRLGRMTKFLDAMEEIEKLVSIFLNVSEAVAFIWGPIKLVLMLATTWTTSVKNIIDVYEEIATALDNLAVFHSLIRSNHQLKRMLEDYFSDILRFHRSILAVFSKPDWKRLFGFIWGEFRRNVKPIIESLKRKQGMLSDDKLQQHAILRTVQDSGSYAKDQFERLHSDLGDVITSEQLRCQQQQKEEIKSSLEKKLNVSWSQTTSQLELPDSVIESSGSWIFSNRHFQSWQVDTPSQGSILFLNGCPGAGKSTLARIIIRQLNDARSQKHQSLSRPVYFFFKHNDADRRSTRSMLCHIVTQIIHSDDTMMRFVYDKCSSLDFLHLAFLKGLALDCLLSLRDPIFILDGLDEGQDNEPQNALKWCLYQLIQTAASQGLHVRILVCGQEDGRIEPLLASYPQIRLHTADTHMRDIEEYCKGKASVIGKRFRLTPDDIQELIIKVSQAAKGMFLYAKVVLANLASMGSRKEFKAELNEKQFPRNLDEAYERILQRIMHAAGPSAQLSAKKILGWLICSERPLRWREIQSRFCIDTDNGLCDPDDVRADSCKQLCSSLVDATDCEMFPGTESEQTITMIHETASKYLVYTNTIDLVQEQIAMSLFCCRYLCSRPFFSIETDEVRGVVESGYFGFMDYAAAYCESHIKKAKLLMPEINPSLASKIKDALSDLEDSYHGSDRHNSADMDAVLGHSEATVKSLVQDIQDKVLDIRTIIHTHWDTLSQNPGFRDLEGEKRHKCPKIYCSKFSVGYSSEDILQHHLNSHERPLRCNDANCFAYVVGYTSKKHLERHIQDFHNEQSQAKIAFPNGSKTVEKSLISCCKSGDLKQVELLHRLGADLHGFSLRKAPLVVAFEAGHGHICNYLIKNNVDPFGIAETPYGKSPIHLAIDAKDFHMLELFLFTYIHLTVPDNTRRFEECIQDIFTSYPPGVDILLRLSATERLNMGSSIIDSLISRQIEVSFDIWKPSLESFPMNMSTIGHSNDSTPIHTIFQELFPKLYIKNKFLPNYNCQEYRIYQQAISRNGILIHDAFVRKHYPLAAFWMDVDTENVLQTKDPEGNSLLHSFLMDSCEVSCDSCLPMVNRLIKLDKAELSHQPNDNGHLPIHIALNKDLSPELLQTLLKFTKDLNHKDIWGTSPLHHVKSEESLNVLLQHQGVDMLSRNKDGQTCFVRFCQTDEAFDEGIMRRLLAADITLAWTADESTEGLTPLHYAMDGDRSVESRRSAARFLLKLPEVDQILEAYSASDILCIYKMRVFAEKEDLQDALEVMSRTGFALYNLEFQKVED